MCNDESIALELQNALVNYRSSKASSGIEEWYLRSLNNLSLEDQFRVLTSLPNYHRWNWVKPITQLKFEQRFSTCSKYYPASPRNRIIQAWCFRDHPSEIINSCIRNILGIQSDVPYPQRSLGGKRNFRRRRPSSVKITVRLFEQTHTHFNFFTRTFRLLIHIIIWVVV